MTQQEREVLASMKDNQFGAALRSLLNDCLDELGDVSKCTSWEDTLGRKHAKEFILEAFRFLEKPDQKPTKKNQYT